MAWMWCLCSRTSPCHGQMTVPFHGQGGFPEEPVDIYVSPMMERLLEVDDKNYRFENVVYLYLSCLKDACSHTRYLSKRKLWPGGRRFTPSISRRWISDYFRLIRKSFKCSSII